MKLNFAVKSAFLAALLAGGSVFCAIDADLRAMPDHKLMRHAQDLRNTVAGHHCPPAAAAHHAALGAEFEAYAAAKHAAQVTHAAAPAAAQQADYDPYFVILKNKIKAAVRTLITGAMAADAPFLDGAHAGAGVVVGANPAALNRNAVLSYIDQEIDAIDVAAVVGHGAALPADDSIDAMIMFTRALRADVPAVMQPILEGIRTVAAAQGPLLVAGTAAASGGRIAGDTRDDFVNAVIGVM